jgi:formylglycine-generating enzyme required for sulfatase activity
VVAVVATLPSGLEQTGSGYLVDARTVLTAEHCTRDAAAGDLPTRLRVIRAPDGRTAEVAAGEVTRDARLDVAVLNFDPPLWDEDLAPVSFCRVDREHAGILQDCTAIGFPLLQRDPGGHRGHAEFHGVIYQTDEAESGRLLMREQNVRPGPIPIAGGSEGSGEYRPSPWGGLSGAVAFLQDAAVGVVVEHHPRQGDNAIQLIGFERIAEQSPKIRDLLRLPQPAQLRLAGSVEAVGAEDLASEIDLAQKVSGLAEPLPLRILFATSSSLGSYHVAGERASIIETIRRAFISSTLGNKFVVQLLEWRDRHSVRQISDSGDEVLPLPALSDIDIVIIVLWHDLGAPLDPPLEAQNELSRLAWQIRDANSDSDEGSPRLLLLRRSGINFPGDDAEALEASRRYERVKAFFDRLAPEQYIPYTNQSFSTLLERRLRIVVSGLLDRAARVDPSRFRQPQLAPQAHNPFRGLQPYTEEDTATFYGRADEINQLAAKFADLICTSRLLVVVGASGSGKSSLVRAGLIPRLSLDGLPGSNLWQYRTFCLSEDSDRPLDVIVDNLAVDLRGDRKKRRELLNEDPASLTPLIEPLLDGKPPETRVVMFIDQFEELFTLIDDKERLACVEVLERALDTRRLVVIVTVRSEFYHRCLEGGLSPKLADHFRTSTYWLLAPSQRALLAMITRPVLFAGAVFEDVYLPLEILIDAGTSPGALPLMSCALQMLYERSPTGFLSRKTYGDLQRVTGVIQHQGDAALADVRKEFDEDDVQEGLGLVFRSLVGVNEDGTATRRPARRAQFTHSPSARRLIDALIDRRLLQSDVSAINVAHEAVLRNWKVLVAWTDKAHGALLLMHRVEREAQEWKRQRDLADSEEARLKIDRDLLWPQDRLDEIKHARELLGTKDWELSQEVRRFIRPEFDRILEELSAEISHDRRAEIGESMATLGDQRPGVALRNGVPDIVWCAVPGGKVAIWDRPGSSLLGEFDVRPFFMAKYPVTLEQFTAFTREDTYYDPTWWERLPVDPRDHRPYAQKPDVPNHPAQYVSWYQMLAFCSWLSDKLGYAIRPPTEWEWVQAAVAGHVDYNYPWGKDWNPNHANHSQELHRLVSVGIYPGGASPGGVFDLSGNIYQWCLNEYDDLTNVDPSSELPHPTRGGAFFTMPPNIDVREQLSIHHRLRDNPNGIGDRGQRLAVGIRLVCDHPSDR